MGKFMSGELSPKMFLGDICGFDIENMQYDCEISKILTNEGCIESIEFQRKNSENVCGYILNVNHKNIKSVQSICISPITFKDFPHKKLQICVN